MGPPDEAAGQFNPREDDRYVVDDCVAFARVSGQDRDYGGYEPGCWWIACCGHKPILRNFGWLTEPRGFTRRQSDNIMLYTSGI